MYGNIEDNIRLDNASAFDFEEIEMKEICDKRGNRTKKPLPSNSILGLMKHFKCTADQIKWYGRKKLY